MTMPPEETGRWVFAVAKHLKVFRQSPQLASLFAVQRSAREGDLLLRIRGLGQSSYSKIEALALDAGIPSQELPETLRRLEGTGIISLEVSSKSGNIERVRERILTENEIYRITAQLFERANPSQAERIIIPSMQVMSQLPLTDEEIISRMVLAGFDELEVRKSIELQEAFHLTRKQKVSDLGVTLLYNDYLWGHKISKIGGILASLPRRETDMLRTLMEEVRSAQGKPMDYLSSVPKHIVNLAAHKGLLDTTTIMTAQGDSKTFAFSPHFYGYRAGPQVDQILDPADQVRLFIASITYGVHHSIDFRLNAPLKFVEKLIRDGEAGNATPVKRDYVLLERQGIVRVEERSPGRGTFIVQKQDIIKSAFDVMQNGTLFKDGPDINDTRSFTTQKSFQSPEENRLISNFGQQAGDTKQFEHDLMATIREEAQKGTW